MAGELWEVVKVDEKDEVIARALRTPHREYAQECANKWNANPWSLKLTEWHIRKIQRGE